MHSASIRNASPGTTLFVLGATGVGKTHAVKEICKDTAFWIDSTKCATAKELREIVNTQLKTNIVATLTGTEVSKKIIVIDELDVLYHMDRGVLSYISEISQTTHVIIVISNVTLDKKIKASTDKPNIIYFSAMSEADICILLRSLFPMESYKDILAAAESCYGNLSHAINMMAVKNTSNQTDIIQQSLVTSDIFTRQSRGNIVKIIEDDPWLVPLRYHENIYKIVTSKVAYKRVIEGMCIWDMLMQLTTTTLIPIEYFASIVLITYASCRKAGLPKECTDFTKLLSNLSLQKKNEKLMYSNDQDFPWMHSQIFCDYIKYR